MFPSNKNLLAAGRDDLVPVAQGGKMTDIELLEAATKVRTLAHNAPFAEWSKDHRGHSAIVNHTFAWADRGREFVSLMIEVRRRGLVLP